MEVERERTPEKRKYLQSMEAMNAMGIHLLRKAATATNARVKTSFSTNFSMPIDVVILWVTHRNVNILV